MAIDRARLAALVERERTEYRAWRPEAQRAHAAARSLLGNVPMTWMRKWAGGFPPLLVSAGGNRLVDADGHEYLDFALGDTGAMAGHSPPAVVAAVRERMETLGGVTTMLPTEDATVVGDELTRRFSVESWSFTLTATDANRWALRVARHLTRRPRILVFSYCYHGSVDESFVVCDEAGVPHARPGNVGPPVDPTTTTRVCEFNDLAALERELSHGDVAAVLAEPALTNIGIVLPEPGFHAGLRELCNRFGAMLVIDETHTFSAGPGGCTMAWDLVPDLVTIGKAIAGGIPIGAYGLRADVADRLLRATDADLDDVGGIGGTLAGNALSLAAARACLTEVLTDDAFDGMIARATEFTTGVQHAIDGAGLRWSISRLGARAEYRFASPPPRTGGESSAAQDDLLDEYLHLYLANRGILLTPFHNMALMCPTTTTADVERHTDVFTAAVRELVA